MKNAFVFVCQSGELEIKSMLLAASLKHFLQGDYELVAAIPEPTTHWGRLSDETQALMQILKIRSLPIVNNIDENYPIGNKVACLGIDTSADQIVFLDSDILCLREFNFPFNPPFSAKPADLNLFTSDISVWKQIYDLFNLPLPHQRVITSTSGELMLPYFNAGVIAIQNGIALKPVWEECCQIIDATHSITNKRPWLDQIALPIALARLNLDYHCLDERFNYPAHLKPLSNSPESLPFLCHYHWSHIIRREPGLNQLVKALAETYPLLKTLILASEPWAQLLKPYTSLKPVRFWKPIRFLKNFEKKHLINNRVEAIITGIPRSGTSYLCRLLHTIPNCVVINEPAPIFTPLTNDLIPWQIATFYQDLRRDILDGLPVENKVQNGKIIEDTAIIDVRAPYQPVVSRPDFLLCTKNTLTYMARLPQLKQVLPHAPIIACVRHPIDSIASWKTSFPHLKQAAVTEFPVGHVNDPFLAPWQHQRLAEIAATPDEALKRALLWRYLAEIILMNAHQLILVHYEMLVTQPVKVLKSILQQIPDAPPLYNTKKISASTVRQKREVLDNNDLQAIGDICRETAVAMGYDDIAK
ncbi:MAG: sulfotransferase [Gammaproteobacteria bacterium]|nr:MAG: sulfotransferase [Gammaproteobacteria bacterium]